MKVPQLSANRSGAPGASISKIGHVSLNRNIAQTPKPSETTGQAEFRIKVFTYITGAAVAGEPTPTIYAGDRVWARVTLTLETAGPVAVGEQSALAPVLSGKGQLLETDVPLTFNVGKGNKLYVAATGINRIKVTVEAFPWLETITGLIGGVLGMIRPAPAPASKI